MQDDVRLGDGGAASRASGAAVERHEVVEDAQAKRVKVTVTPPAMSFSA
jgi:hypothetical protein